MFSLRHWLADRSELVEWIGEKDDNIAWASEEILNLQFRLTAKHDAMLAASERSKRLAGENGDIRDQLKVAEANADVFRDQRDEARAKLVPPTRDPVTGRWAHKS